MDFLSDSENILVNSNLQRDSSFRIFWNVFDSENCIQKCHFYSPQDCVTREKGNEIVTFT